MIGSQKKKLQVLVLVIVLMISILGLLFTSVHCTGAIDSVFQSWRDTTQCIDVQNARKYSAYTPETLGVVIMAVFLLLAALLWSVVWLIKKVR